MKEQHKTPCDSIVLYLTGECSRAERLEFEHHLPSCPLCRQELEELGEVWAALPLQAQELETPGDLKAEVMRAIFANDETSDSLSKQRAEYRTFSYEQKKKTSIWLYGSAAAVFFIVLACTLWWTTGPSGAPDKTAPIAVNEPAQIVKTYALKSFDSSMPNAGGNAWILRQGDTNKVVVQLNGLTKTSGGEAYQVWLIREGKRYNCGTLVVNEQGSGVLTYEVKRKDMQFDAIGVTLEPDANGTQPRGKKVLGS